MNQKDNYITLQCIQSAIFDTLLEYFSNDTIVKMKEVGVDKYVDNGWNHETKTLNLSQFYRLAMQQSKTYYPDAAFIASLDGKMKPSDSFSTYHQCIKENFPYYSEPRVSILADNFKLLITAMDLIINHVREYHDITPAVYLMSQAKAIYDNGMDRYRNLRQQINQENLDIGRYCEIEPYTHLAYPKFQELVDHDILTKYQLLAEDYPKWEILLQEETLLFDFSAQLPSDTNYFHPELLNIAKEKEMIRSRCSHECLEAQNTYKWEYFKILPLTSCKNLREKTLVEETSCRHQ